MGEKILLYADGAAIPNPGEMSIGVVLLYKGHTKEIAKKLGRGSNNVAELEAIKAGLEAIKDRTVPVEILSDSQYALNSIAGKWNGSANRELIKQVREIVSGFDSVKFKWVRGHNGDEYQERAHNLANQFLGNGFYV